MPFDENYFDHTDDGRLAYAQYLSDYLQKGGMDFNMQRKYLRFMLKNYNPPPSEDKIEDELKLVLTTTRFSCDNGYKSLAAEIREWVLSTNGHFMSTDVHRDLCLSTRVHKKNCSEVLRRLINDGMIERYGSKSGMFRVVQRNFSVTDLKHVERTRMDIKLIFGLDRFAAVKPGNVILFQGVRNTGKTAVLLNCAKLNLDGPQKVYFFSSEADEEEMADLVEADKITNWSKMRFSSDWDNYMDIIQPNDINIIDYIEIKGQQEAYEIPKMITEIHDRLQKGIAIIALQKKKGQDIGFGGYMVESKPRIVCNIDPMGDNISRIKVSKAKIKGPIAKEKNIHPQGLWIRFRTDDGINLQMMDRGWRKA